MSPLHDDKGLNQNAFRVIWLNQPKSHIAPIALKMNSQLGIVKTPKGHLALGSPRISLKLPESTFVLQNLCRQMTLVIEHGRTTAFCFDLACNLFQGPTSGHKLLVLRYNPDACASGEQSAYDRLTQAQAYWYKNMMSKKPRAEAPGTPGNLCLENARVANQFDLFLDEDNQGFWFSF